MNQLNVNLPELPYAVSEAMNRLRINIKFCGKNTRKILLTSCQPNEGSFMMWLIQIRFRNKRWSGSHNRHITS